MPLVVVAAYLIGSVPFALLVSGRRVDLRRVGSGNLGATNVLRSLGVRRGVVVALLDVAKGAFSVWLAGRLVGGTTAAATAGVAAVVGHVYPVWLRFRGGKGVATACGAFAVLTPVATAVALGVFFASVWVTRYVSAGSMLASATLPPVAYVTGAPSPVVAAACGAALVIILRHRANMGRMRSGTERSIGYRETRL